MCALYHKRKKKRLQKKIEKVNNDTNCLSKHRGKKNSEILLVKLVSVKKTLGFECETNLNILYIFFARKVVLNELGL